MARASKTHHYSLFPHCTGTVSPMVNRNAIHSFVLFAVALFFQQSRFPVWTKVPKYAILNNLSQGDSKNIHFMATCESFYLRQQRQTLERGEVRFQEGKKNKKITTTFCGKQREKQRKWNKMEIAFLWCQRLILSLTLGGCLGFLLKLFDSAVTMKSSNRFTISVFVFVGFIFMFYLFGWAS